MHKGPPKLGGPEDGTSSQFPRPIPPKAQHLVIPKRGGRTKDAYMNKVHTKSVLHTGNFTIPNTKPLQSPNFMYCSNHICSCAACQAALQRRTLLSCHTACLLVVFMEKGNLSSTGYIGVRRERRNQLSGNYMGITFPYSSLTSSEESRKLRF